MKMEEYKLPLGVIEKMLFYGGTSVRVAAFNACHGRDDIPLSLIEKGLRDEDDSVRKAAVKACHGRDDIHLYLIEKGLKDDKRWIQNSVAEACHSRNIPLDVIGRWIKDDKIYGTKVCMGRAIPLDIIEKWMEDWNRNFRKAAMNACYGRNDIPIDFIEKGLKDDQYKVREAAKEPCHGMDVPLDVIERWMEDDDANFRSAAMEACHGRNDISFGIIEKGLNDVDIYVRVSANKVCHANGIEIPVVRSFEPNEKVYKKCLFGVVVVAKIPSDAHVMGRSGEGRASKALITDIIGDVFGEKVGISEFDKKTMYRVGDQVVIDDFDLSDEWDLTGFHFFNTLKRAMNS